MKTVAAALLVGLIAAVAPADDGPVVQFPGASKPCRLRFDVRSDGVPVTASWDAFLDRLLDYFDRDGDGSLAGVEVGRMFPLPLPGRQHLPFEFGKLDADADGRASRAELKAYCRDRGFVPVVAIVEPPSADDLRLGELLSGPDQAKLLRKFDLNEDEYLTAEELLASAPPRLSQEEAQARSVAAKETAVLRVDLGDKTAKATAEGVDLVAPSEGLFRLKGPDGNWSASVRPSRVVPDLSLAGDFLTAQFKDALGDKPALPKATLDQDPTLGGLTELFPFADRDGDDRLSLAELETYLKLVDQGLRSQVWVRVTERGHNPFPLLDADGDGRLSERELAKASEAVKGGELPWQFQITFGSPVAASWGRVQIPTPRRSQPAVKARPPLPRWLGAMDRNDDGTVSVREFIGSPKLFRELDADGDGVIDFEEGRRAKD